MIYIFSTLLVITLAFFLRTKNNFKKSIYLFLTNLIVSLLAYNMGFSFFAMVFIIISIVGFFMNWIFALSSYPISYKVNKNIDVRYTPYVITLFSLVNAGVFVFLIDSNADQLEETAKSISNVHLVMKNFFIDYQSLIMAIPLFLFVGVIMALEFKEDS